MGLKELWTGGEEVEKARETRQRIEEKSRTKKLRAREETKLEQSVSITRRQFLKQAGLATIGLGGLVAGISISECDNKQSPDKPPKKNRNTHNNSNVSLGGSEIPPNQEQLTDELIKKIEKGMQEFKKVVEAKLSDLQDEKLRKLLMSPFSLVENNKTNPEKNRRTAERRYRGKKFIHLRSDFHFHYLAEKVKGAAAAFSPFHKCVIISPDFDPQKLMDMIHLYHELWHAISDAHFKRRATPEQLRRYMEYWRKQHNYRKRVALNYEAWAYAYSIELTNLLLNGNLRTTVERRNQFNVPEIMYGLNANEKDKGGLIIMLGLAQALYPHGIQTSPTRFPKNFYKKLAYVYKVIGKNEIYVQNANGLFERYNGTLPR